MTDEKKDLMLRISGMGEEAAIEAVVRDMWGIYDEDKNGTLDFEEVKKFVKDALATMCKSSCYDDHIFIRLFKKFDADGNNQIDRDEVKHFIKELISNHGTGHNHGHHHH